MAAVAPGARVLDAACGDGRHLAPLARLGFDVWGSAEGDPAAARARLGDVVGEAEATRRVTPRTTDVLDCEAGWAHWVVLARDATALLGEAARVVQPGGWVWVEMAPDDAEAVEAAAAEAGLVIAEPAGVEGERAHIIFRRPGVVR